MSPRHLLEEHLEALDLAATLTPLRGHDDDQDSPYAEELAALALDDDEGGRDIWTIAVAGARCAEVWTALRDMVEETGHWPIILGEERERDFVQETLSYELNGAPAEILARAEPIYQGLTRDTPYPAAEREGWTRGRIWAAEFSVPNDYRTRQPHPLVYLALVPTGQPWEVAAHMNFGNWNACPPAEEHVARWRRWYDHFGAEIVCLSHDIAEFRLRGHTPGRADVLETLAREQYDYCNDIVDQGVGTLERLVMHLEVAPTWYFWWD